MRCRGSFTRRLKARAVTALERFVWSLCIHARSISLECLSPTASTSRKHRSMISDGHMEKDGAPSTVFRHTRRGAVGSHMYAVKSKLRQLYPPYLWRPGNSFNEITVLHHYRYRPALLNRLSMSLSCWIRISG